MLFFAGVQYTTVTNANMLNMLYPVFVLVLAPFFNKEPFAKNHFVYVSIALAGTYFVIMPNYAAIRIGDIFSFASAIVSAVAVISLRESRKHDSTPVILFHLMGFGLVINGIAMIPVFTMPDCITFMVMLLSGLSAYLGQALFTLGFKYIDAASGSIISSSRIIFATCIGIFYFHEPFTYTTLLGGMLITAGIIGASLYSK